MIFKITSVHFAKFATFRLCLILLLTLGLNSISHATDSNLFSEVNPEPVSKWCNLMYEHTDWPKSNYRHHQYILLLMFQDASGATAAHEFFHTQDDSDPTQPRSGCVADPDYTSPRVAGSPSGLALKVKGHCPRDCTEPLEFLEHTGRIRGSSAGPLPDPDPLKKPHNWGIFFADPSGNGRVVDDDPDTRVHVWQILVKDAAHASRLMQVIEPQLKTIDGYRGQMLIGYENR
jgi:hypothetical protein